MRWTVTKTTKTWAQTKPNWFPKPRKNKIGFAHNSVPEISSLSWFPYLTMDLVWGSLSQLGSIKTGPDLPLISYLIICLWLSPLFISFSGRIHQNRPRPAFNEVFNDLSLPTQLKSLWNFKLKLLCCKPIIPICVFFLLTSKCNHNQFIMKIHK